MILGINELGGSNPRWLRIKNTIESMSNLLRIVIEWGIVALILLVFGWLITEPTDVLGWFVKIPLLAILYGCFRVLDDFIPESIKKENYDTEEH